MKACFFMLFGFFVLSSSVYASDKEQIEIVVEQNDKLITICRKYLEYPEQWREVAKLNQLDNPHLILPGQKLIIPIALLKGAPLDATVSFIKGDVQIRSKDSEIWKTLRLNDKIYQGDTIKTGDASSAELTFEDATMLLLRSHTALEVKTSAQKGGFCSIRELMQRAGRTISRLKAATGNELRFKIHTPSAVAAARGTEFRVSID